MRKHLVLTLTLVVAGAGGVRAAELAKSQVDFFENKIRPILSSTCFKCHNAAEGKLKGDLALDTKEGTLKGGENGPAVVPGNPDKSLLIKAVSYKDPNLQMPPKGEKLSDAQIADLIAWVKMGAPDPRGGAMNAKYKGKSDAARQHWAYQPVKKPTPPVVKQSGWVQNPMDNFILAKLEEKGMKPNHPADRATLIRRVYFDLIGFPPTPAETQACVDDKSPDAFEKIVNKLLDSPHYGERWGRYWLDVARYADTRGQDNRRNDARYPYAWTYRDYVIKSFNDDKPYNKFVMEQIAADKLLTGTDTSSLAALGFLTLGERFAGNNNDIINDRIDVVTKGFLAMTVACARCHDHMFDPIPTKDYYSLHGVFNSCAEPKELPLIAKIDTSSAQYRNYLTERNRLINDLHHDADKQINDQLSEFRKKAGGYLMFAYSDGKAREAITDTYKLKRDVNQFVQNRVRRGGNADPVLGPWNELAQAWKKDEKTFPAEAAKIVAKVAANQPGKPGNSKKGAPPAPGKQPYNPMVAGMFKANPAPKTLTQAATYYTSLFSSVDIAWSAQVKAAEARGGFPAPLSNPYLEQIRNTPVIFTTSATLEIDELIALVPNGLQGRIRGKADSLSVLETTHPGAPARATILVDKPTATDSPVFLRGETANRGDTVPRRFLEILSGPNRQPFRAGSGRLELAQSIADPKNPLTARVMVNRLWLHHFGEGIIPTPDDFGTMSELPTHPEMLDYLASQFMENGWSIKKMHRLILLSATWQQSSDNNPHFAQIDPYNRFLWRANIRKLEFEAIRDSLLFIGGRLDLAVGGKPVNTTSEPYSYRRSVYGYIDRSAVPEVMTHFDFATPDAPSGRRYNTMVPQQALFMMNSPQVVDVARTLTSRPEFRNARTDDQRVAALYEVIYQRQPRPEEIKLGTEFASARVAIDPADYVQAPAMQPGKKGGQAQKKPQVAGKRGPRDIVNKDGKVVSRTALSGWEKYAQALLLANEASYVN
ncbi:MAG: PSD1 domain-containing protein [Verrucomicrobia bacterium]|nr:PSD1 domain-containing protein [Verrucomicrobiota bacterium]